MVWHKVADGDLPKSKICEVLVVRNILPQGLKPMYVYEVMLYTYNLQRTGNEEFTDDSYDRAGFYTFDDDSNVYEVTNVEAWTEIKEYKS
jgi:hypothetical protein